MDTLQLKEMEEQIEAQQRINERLLRKYVIAKTEHLSENTMACLFSTIVVVGMGVWAHFLIDLKWPVIITICSAMLLSLLFELFNSYPLSEGRLIVTDINALQPILLRHKKYNTLFYFVLLPIFTASFVWLAFELRDVFTKSFFFIKYDDRLGILAFYVTIIFAIVFLGGGIYSLYSTIKKIDKLVAEIDELHL